MHNSKSNSVPGFSFSRSWHHLYKGITSSADIWFQVEKTHSRHDSLNIEATQFFYWRLHDNQKGEEVFCVIEVIVIKIR
jgi:hypothetical protein